MKGINAAAKELGYRPSDLKKKLQSMNVLDSSNQLTPAAIQRGVGFREKKTIFNPGTRQVVVTHNVYNVNVIQNMLTISEVLPEPEPVEQPF